MRRQRTLKSRKKTAIPADRLARNPLITPAAFHKLKSILQHPAAPEWNYTVGDRIDTDDLPQIAAVRKTLRRARTPGTGTPPHWVADWLRIMRPNVPLFQSALPEGFNMERDWIHIPTMSRQDIAARLDDIVPANADISRLIVYDTSGVTGHAIQVPHHPLAMAKNHAFLEFALARHGVKLSFTDKVMACMNVGAQLNTVVFATVFAAWNNAAFAKVNLHQRRWDPERAQRFFNDQRPLFLTGDPVGFAEMMKWGITARPAAMVSTAVALTTSLKEQLRSCYGCPVIDTYATTETGTVAYDSPDGEGMNILPTDIYVETVDENGIPVPEGERGELCITGGRNPYVPLLRYRTGDFARLVWSDPAPSDPSPIILDLEAREAITFRADDGTAINPVDIGRLIRQWVFSQHEFVQRKDRSCKLILRPVRGCPVDTGTMAAQLKEMFGPAIRLEIKIDEHLGDNRPGGKVIPFRSELEASGLGLGVGDK